MKDLFNNEYKINKPIRLIELFAGIGSQAMALRNIGANFEHYRVIEFDKYAIKSYNAIHGTNFETSDIRNVRGLDLGIVDCEKFTYLLTYSFPCQDLSVAGLGKGMKKGNGTRSGLLWEVERLLNETKNLPQVLLMENVPQVHGKKNLADFNAWMDFLKSNGYQNFWQDLNAKDYGVAQNRKRCFMVSILSKDFINFEFPEKIELKKVMKDYLEDTVDEKYYINNEKVLKLIESLIMDGGLENEKKPSGTEGKRLIPASLGKSSDGRFVSINDAKIKDVNKKLSSTLLSRDYKGLSRNNQNCVIERSD